MTTYRLFPATSGPSSANSYGGNILTGVNFAVAGGGNWFQGYWLWVASNGNTAATKCALWSVLSSTSGVLVPNSVVTSGTLTQGQWNYVPLATPLQLAPSYDSAGAGHGSAYLAAVGVNGNFPTTTSQFNSGDVHSAGITSGPLVAYSGTTGSNPAPYSMAQGVFAVASDPSVTMPHQADSSGDGGTNFWVDVQVSTTAPSGYAGSYRLWPNKYDANSSVGGDSALNYTIGTEVHLTSGCTLDNAWYYSQSGAASLATRCDVWSISTGLSVASITSPSWLTASGSAASAGGGWVKAAFAGSTTLPAGSYRVTVYNSGGTSGSWAARDASTDYWGQSTSTGAGASGITWGPLTAPSQPGASSGYVYNASDGAATPAYSSGTAVSAQSVFGQLPGGGITYPQLYAPVGGSSNQAQNYWVDLEVTPLADTPSPFTVPSAAVRGRAAARRGTSAGSTGAPLPAAPSLFTAPSRAARAGTAARRGSSRGPASFAPAVPFPSPFTAPCAARRGGTAARRGTARGSAGAAFATVPPPFTAPSRARRGCTAARPGAARGSAGAPYSPASSPFTAPSRARRAGTAARPGTSRGTPFTAPAPRPSPSPFTVPCRALVTRQAARRGTSRGSAGAAWAYAGAPAPFTLPHRSHSGARKAVTGRSAGSAGAPWSAPRPESVLFSLGPGRQLWSLGAARNG